MQHCSLQHWTRHIRNWVLFLLWFHLFILSGVISPMISWSILATHRPGEFIFQCLICLPFHSVHGVLKARILKWFAIPFSSGPRFLRTVHHDLLDLGGLQGMAHRFIELDKAGLQDSRIKDVCSSPARTPKLQLAAENH